MAITVFTAKDHYTHEKGADWYIDEQRLLYIRDASKKHIATYHSMSWRSVANGEPRPSEAERSKLEILRLESEIRKASAGDNPRSADR